MTATIRNLEGQDEASILREIHSALSGLKFGSVEITVHNGQVVQIERKEKFRLQPGEVPPAPDRQERLPPRLPHPSARLDHRRA